MNEGRPAQTAAQEWKDLSTRPTPKPRRYGPILAFVSILLLIMLIFTAVRASTVASGADDILQVQVGNQQTAQVDLRQSFPISPYLMGTNVFPADSYQLT